MDSSKIIAVQTSVLTLSPVDNSTCLFDTESPLYSQQLRDALRPVDSLVSDCSELEEYWMYLIGLMSLCFVGFILSIVSLLSNCVVPCVESRYDKDTAV